MRLVVLVGALLLLALLVRSLVAGGRRAPVRGAPPAAAGEDLVRDPVCGAYVPRSAAVAAPAGGETRLFCSDACAERFRAAGRTS